MNMRRRLAGWSILAVCVSSLLSSPVFAQDFEGPAATAEEQAARDQAQVEEAAQARSGAIEVLPVAPDPSLARAYSTPEFPGQGNFSATIFQHANTLRQSASQMPVGPTPDRALKLGDQGSDVVWLVQALAARGYSYAIAQSMAVPAAPASASYLPSAYPSPISDVFDADLEIAVRQYQRDHGLADDGIAGPRVVTLLSTNAAALASALDSWGQSIQAWSSQMRSAGYDRMIVVNLPSFTLHAINLATDEVELESRVIVGTPRTKTPRMLTRVVNLKANPDWSPPKSIRGARYQRPGPNNALGLMRFSTDNRMSIYLHDTNSRQLFARDVRALSHGCVRVQQWHDLAAWSARQSRPWVDEVALVGGKTRFLPVDPIPVLIVYSRVDVVEGQAQVFPDIYGLGDGGIGHAALNGRVEPAPQIWHSASQGP